MVLVQRRPKQGGLILRQRHRLLLTLYLFLGLAHHPSSATATPTDGHDHNKKDTNSRRTFAIDYDQNTFLLDGQAFRYISGSIHYFRIPQALWRDRLWKIKAGGYNAIQFVIEWSSHEPHPGQYNFQGRFDLIQFIQTAQDVGLFVLLRPGPYICAERNGGGLPYWLYALHPDMALRSSDVNYLNFVDKWFDKLLPMLQPYIIQNGGPILITQLENEYGSFGCDLDYKIHLRDKVQQYFGKDHVLYTTDGGFSEQMVKCGSVEGAYATVDFGPGMNVTQAFDLQRQFAPQGPLVNSEYYPGWLDYWGQPHSTVSVNRSIETLREILDAGANVNVYMAHGGTSFGFEAGANLSPLFQPEPTSYDYDAPISEAGDLTPKYYAFRDLFAKYLPTNNHTIPFLLAHAPKQAYGIVPMQFVGSIFDVIKGSTDLDASLWEATTATNPKTFEELDQNTGFVLYETCIPRQVQDPVILKVYGLRDRASVFINESFQGILSRINEIKISDGSAVVSMPLSAARQGDKLQLFVENQGRIGYGPHIKEFKGLTGNVTLGDVELQGWTMYKMPLENTTTIMAGIAAEAQKKSASTIASPASSSATAGSFWRGSFVVANCTTTRFPGDTFLKIDQGWGKGIAWINHVNLGRYWPHMGPQETLYVPGPCMRCGENNLTLLELERVPSSREASMIAELVDTAQIDGPTPKNKKSIISTN